MGKRARNFPNIASALLVFTSVTSVSRLRSLSSSSTPVAASDLTLTILRLLLLVTLLFAFLTSLSAVPMSPSVLVVILLVSISIFVLLSTLPLRTLSLVFERILPRLLSSTIVLLPGVLVALVRFLCGVRSGERPIMPEPRVIPCGRRAIRVISKGFKFFASGMWNFLLSVFSALQLRSRTS